MTKKEKILKNMDKDLINDKVRNYKKFIKKYNELKHEKLYDKKKKGGDQLCYK